MKMRIALTIVMFCVIRVSIADTTWVASGDVSGIWDSGGSPYMIHSGDVTVAANETLIIESGVTVYFTARYMFFVNGLLQVNGTEQDSVFFTGSTTNPAWLDVNRWGGIRFINAHENCRLSYCFIENGGASGPDEFYKGGGVYSLNTDLTMENCTVSHCLGGGIDPVRETGYGSGIYVSGGDVAITGCTIENNSVFMYDSLQYLLSTVMGMGIYHENGNIAMDGCRIFRNTAGNEMGPAYNTKGAGAYFGEGSTATVDSCHFELNLSDSYGGGIYVDIGADLTIRDTRLHSNYAEYGGGGGLASFGTLLMEDCLIDSNRTNTFPGYGGTGVSILGGNATIRECVLEYNSGGWDGGAIRCINTQLINCDIRSNFAYLGGGIWCGDNVTVSECSFSSNSVSGIFPNLGAESGEGGAVFCIEGSPLFERCEFTHNKATVLSDEPDGLFAGSGGVVFSRDNGSPVFRNCIFAHNMDDDAVSGGNGSVYFGWFGGSATFEYCTMFDNPADSLTYVIPYDGPFTFPGGIIHCEYQGDVTLNNCIISHTDARAAVLVEGNSSASINNCDFFGISGRSFDGSVPAGLGDLVAVNSNGDSIDVFNNILLDPEYLNAASDDFHLADSSPCISAANPVDAPDEDYDGNPRPFPSNSLPDIGAFESPQGNVSAVEGLTIIPDLTTGNVVLNWNEFPGASEYHVYYGATAEEAAGLTNLVSTTSGTTYIDEGVLGFSDETRFYIVIAY